MQDNGSFFKSVFNIINEYGVWFLEGAAVTLFIALIGTIVGFMLGILIGVVKTIPLKRVTNGFSLYNFMLKTCKIVSNIYIEVFRGTPMIVQAVIIYYGLMEAFKIDISTLTAGLLVVSINTGAYMAEVVRGGIESIDKGQTEAAYAIGMNHTKTMRYVIIPQAIRNILPALGNEFIINIKDTSVLNVISVTELYFMTKSVKGLTYKTYESFLIAAAIYLVMTLTVSFVLRKIEKKMDGPKNFALTSSTTNINIINTKTRRGESDFR